MTPSISLTRSAFNRLSVLKIKTETVSSPSTKRWRRQINLFLRNTCSLRKLLHFLWEKTIDSSLMNSFKNFYQSWRVAKEGKKRKWQSINFSIDVQKSLSFKREIFVWSQWGCQKQEKPNHDWKSDKRDVTFNARWQQISRNQKLVQSTPNRLRRIKPRKLSWGRMQITPNINKGKIIFQQLILIFSYS